MSRACIAVARLSLAALIAIAMPLRPTADGPQLTAAYAKDAQTKRAPERSRDRQPLISDVVNIVNVVIGAVLRELPGGNDESERRRPQEPVVIVSPPEVDEGAAEVRRHARTAAPEQVPLIPLSRPAGLGKVIEEASVLAAMVPPAPLHAETRPRAFVRGSAPVSLAMAADDRIVARAVPAAPVPPVMAEFRTLSPVPVAEGQATLGDGEYSGAVTLAATPAPGWVQRHDETASVPIDLASPTGTTAADTTAGGPSRTFEPEPPATATPATATPATATAATTPPTQPHVDLATMLRDLEARLSESGGGGQHRDLAAILIYGLAAILAASVALRVAQRPVHSARRKAAAERGRQIWRAAGTVIAESAWSLSRLAGSTVAGAIRVAGNTASAVSGLIGRTATGALRVAGNAATGAITLGALAGRYVSAGAAGLAAVVVAGTRLVASGLLHAVLFTIGMTRTRVVPAVGRTVAAATRVAEDRIVPAARSGITTVGHAAASHLLPAARDGIGKGLDRATGALSAAWPSRGADRSAPAKSPLVRAAAARKSLLSEEDAVRAVRMAFDRLESQSGAKRAS